MVDRVFRGRCPVCRSGNLVLEPRNPSADNRSLLFRMHYICNTCGVEFENQTRLNFRGYLDRNGDYIKDHTVCPDRHPNCVLDYYVTAIEPYENGLLARDTLMFCPRCNRHYPVTELWEEGGQELLILRDERDSVWENSVTLRDLIRRRRS